MPVYNSSSNWKSFHLQGRGQLQSHQFSKSLEPKRRYGEGTLGTERTWGSGARCGTDTDLEAIGFLGEFSHENRGVCSRRTCRERDLPWDLKHSAVLFQSQSHHKSSLFLILALTSEGPSHLFSPLLQSLSLVLGLVWGDFTPNSSPGFRIALCAGMCSVRIF